MNATLKNRNEFEDYPYWQYIHKSEKYNKSHERFVVPWQMETKKEKKETK